MVTRTISSMPFLGGTFNQVASQQAMVRLTASRMVWVYSQLNPNWIITSIIDTQGGYTSANMPVATTQQLTIQGSLNGTNYRTYAARLTDNSFLILSQSYFSYPNNSYPTYYWVCSIDDSNVVSVVDTGSFFVGASQNGYSNSLGAGYTDTTLAEISDNTVMMITQQSASWFNYVMTFNTTTKKLVVPTTYSTVYNSMYSIAYGDWHVSKVPNRPQYTMITRRYATGSGTNAYQMNGSTSAIFDSTGAIYMAPATLPQNTNAAGNMDMVPMPGDRLLITSLNNATVYAIDYAAKTWRVISQSQFSTLSNQDTAGRYVIPLNADYWFIMSRSNLWTGAANTRCKVVRRVDSQYIEQSVASNANTGNGFAITATPGTFMNPQGQYPELINGKIFYWGFDGAATGNITKLSWSVLSLPSA